VGVNSPRFNKKANSKERNALLMNNTIFFIPDAVGKMPSRSAPVDRI
jgi:hypothetical protein